jgi:hypothetical protein
MAEIIEQHERARLARQLRRLAAPSRLIEHTLLTKPAAQHEPVIVRLTPGCQAPSPNPLGVELMTDYRVVKTLDDPGGGRRVEIYQRVNGTFGFEEWTFGVDENAWYPSGRYSYAVIDTLEKAEQEARCRIAWLDSN